MPSIEARLHELLCDYQPSKLIMVGDLVHDKSGAHEGLSLIKSLREESEVILIGGNHDIEINRQRSNTEYSRFDLVDSLAI